MTASNQIFLVMDAGTPVAAFTARQELKAYLSRRLDAFIDPAGLYVLGQPRDAVDHDDVGGAGRVVGACEARSDLTRALRASPIVAEKTRPQGCKPQDTSEGPPRATAAALRS
jgi:hypothetical protein